MSKSLPYLVELAKSKPTIERAVERVITRRKELKLSRTALGRYLCGGWKITPYAAAQAIDMKLENPVHWWLEVPRNRGRSRAVANAGITTAELSSARMLDYLASLAFSEQEARELFGQLSTNHSPIRYTHSNIQPLKRLDNNAIYPVNSLDSMEGNSEDFAW